MIFALTVVVCAASLVLMVLSGVYASRDRLIDDRLLAVSAVVFVGTMVQLVLGLLGQPIVGGAHERFPTWLMLEIIRPSSSACASNCSGAPTAWSCRPCPS